MKGKKHFHKLITCIIGVPSPLFLSPPPHYYLKFTLFLCFYDCGGVLRVEKSGNRREFN